MVPSVSLADLEHETWEESITNPAVVFEDSVVFRLNRRGALNLRRGLPVKAEDFVERPKEPVGKRTGVLDEDGSLIAIATIGHGGTLLERRILQAL
ncbi:MAG: hypothetical protein JKX97_07430 [Candidatus Lindowbacteria bacterium]|nr:hypothetical protein [Candidatus Lindowbacteria bacterium]